MSSGDAKKRMREAARKARKQGFDVEFAKNGHYIFTAPDGQRVQVAATPTSASGVRTQIQRLKRIGYQP